MATDGTTLGFLHDEGKSCFVFRFRLPISFSPIQMENVLAVFPLLFETFVWRGSLIPPFVFFFLYTEAFLTGDAIFPSRGYFCRYPLLGSRRSWITRLRYVTPRRRLYH